MFQNSDIVRHADTALVVEGGAMRGIFSTGVLDEFLFQGFDPFYYHIGVSAGATNLASFRAGMKGRNYRVYTDYSLRPEFISWLRFFKGGHLMDLDWLWDITVKELRLDLSKIVDRESKYLVGITSADSGEVEYVNPSIENLEEILKASSSIPILYRNQVVIGGKMYVDGGLADPIPVVEAYRRGARKIMVLRSRKFDYQMKAKAPSALYRHFLKDYPRLFEAAVNRPARYAEAIEFIRNPPQGVSVIEINPPSVFATSRLTKDKRVLDRDYKLGIEAAKLAIGKWNSMSVNK